MSGDLVKLAERMPDGARQLVNQIKLMINNGKKLNTEEAMALAMFGYREGLDPLNGECWILKKGDNVIGCMVGIKGLRRKATEAMGGETWYSEFRDITKTYDLADESILCAYECTIRNTKATSRWIELQDQSKNLNFTPEQIIETFGHPPKWVGVGVVRKNEYAAVNYPQTSRAKKRAEAEAIKAMMGWGYDLMDDTNGEIHPKEDLIDIEYTEEQSKPEIQPEVKEVKPETKTARPLAPDLLAEMIAKKADGYRKDGKKANENDRRGLIANLALLTTGDDNLRHSLTEYLTGEQSTKNLDDGNVLALNDWMKSYQHKESGEWIIDSMAQKEYKRIVEEVFGNGSGK